MDPTESNTRLARIPANCRLIHLMGIGGTAMAALAGMLKERGFAVSGSDNELYEPTASLLKRMHIDARRGFAPSNLDPAPDLVVVEMLSRAITARPRRCLKARFRMCRCPKRFGISFSARDAR